MQSSTQEMLIKLGIPSLFTNIEILLNGKTPQMLAQTMFKTVGRIYGISTYTDTVTYNNQPLITSSNCMYLYLTFVKGTNNFAGRYRFDDFNYNTITTVSPMNKYLEINLPGVDGIDFDKTFIDNPTGITNKTVSLNLLYIDKDTYQYMEKQGIVLRNAQSLKGK